MPRPRGRGYGESGLLIVPPAAARAGDAMAGGSDDRLKLRDPGFGVASPINGVDPTFTIGGVWPAARILMKVRYDFPIARQNCATVSNKNLWGIRTCSRGSSIYAHSGSNRYAQFRAY